MLVTTYSGAVRGIDGYLVKVEVYVRGGADSFRTVGLPDTAVRESRERVLAAVKNSGFDYPEGHITTHLAPADVPKRGAAFDLAVAMSLQLMLRDGGTRRDGLRRLRDTLFLGELALDGSVRSVRGVLPVAVQAARGTVHRVVVPSGNASEAALVDGLAVYGVDSLRQAVDLVDSGFDAARAVGEPCREPGPHCIDLAEVKGQARAKRALEVSAAGGHNLLLVGPPGAGKSLLARRLVTILPTLSLEKSIETTRVYSVAGLLDGRPLVTEPPFRAPHHTTSCVAMVGGGRGPMPGEVSLAHHGVLFLDELAEFPRQALESLRQPLEEGEVRIRRVEHSARFPCRFALVAAMNPCPCGFHGAEARACECTPAVRRRYSGKVSGPLMDRIDLQVPMRPLSADELLNRPEGESSEIVRRRVELARERQAHRFRSHPDWLNSAMSPRQIRRYCELAPPDKKLLEAAIDRFGLSARGFDRILKVARTLADLAGAERIGAEHLHEAISYRNMDRTR